MAAPRRMPEVKRLTPYTKLVIGCLALAVLARVGYVLASWNFAPRIDNRDYLQRAIYLYRFGHFLGVTYKHKFYADAYWPPVFPLFLTALVNVYHWLHDIGLTGTTSQVFAVQNYHAYTALGFIRFMRIAEGTITAFAVLPLIWIARTLWGRRVALIAGLLFAVFPPLVYVSDSLFSESLFTPLLICALAAVLAYRRGRGRGGVERRWIWLLVAGVLTGLAALCHSDGIVAVLPLAVGVWLGTERGAAPDAAVVPEGAAVPASAPVDHPADAWRRRLRRLAPAGALIIVTLLTVSPWTIRNAIELHTFVPISDSAGRTLAGVYNTFSAHDPDQPAAFHWQFQNVEPYRRLIAEHPAPTPALSSAEVHAAFAYVKAHPLYPLRVAFWNTVRILELTGGGGTEERAVREGINLSFAWVADVAFWILGICALFGAFAPAVWRGRDRWIWLMPLTMYLAVVFINTSTPRFRDPIDPFLVMLAAVAISGWWERWRRADS